MIEVKNGNTYVIKPIGEKSEIYFERKYVKKNPEIVVEGRDTDLWPAGWGSQNGNPACILFGIRVGMDIAIPGVVYYGHVQGMGELVMEEELEEVGNA